ncbi:hypothetical protein H4582DRAFT_1970370 [Lactarius indigo]|nr:hypothetical protein H4582DRAFT_1970370 [Lactarius indigo]
MVYPLTKQSVHRRGATGDIGPRSKSPHRVDTAIKWNPLPDSWATLPRHFWHAIAKRLFPRSKCLIVTRKDDIEDLVASLAWRDEGKSPEDILPLAEVIKIIYKSMGEHGLRVEDHTRVRALVRLIYQMKDLLEGRKEDVEDEYREHGMSRADDSGSRIACPFRPSDTSEASSVKDIVLEGHNEDEEVEDEIGENDMSEADDSDARNVYSIPSDASEATSAICSEYTVRSVASWKERTSCFFRPAGGSGAQMSRL